MKVYSILDYGAKPDGNICTKAIQRAIDECSKTGGTVEIPNGTFITGNLKLKSNITINISRGGVLKGSSDIEDYKGFEYIHNEFGKVLSLIHAMDCENITFTGEGMIDFNGDAFFDYTKPHCDKVDLAELNEEQMEQFAVKCESRPNQMMFLKRCKNVKIKNLIFLNAPCWGIVLSSSENIKINAITIRFGLRIPNSDGIHLCSCKNVIISDCDIISGDDCIAITGIDDWYGVSTNIVITNCLLSSASAGIRVGYWKSVVRNVQISNCVLYDCNRGICMMSCGSGLVEDVSITNVKIHTKSRIGGWWGIGEPLFILGLEQIANNMPGAEYNQENKLVNIRNITFRDINIETENSIVMIAQSNVHNIKIYNMNLSMIDNPNKGYFKNRLDLQPSKEQIDIPNDRCYWGYFEGIDQLKMSDVDIVDRQSSQNVKIEVFMNNCN